MKVTHLCLLRPMANLAAADQIFPVKKKKIFKISQTLAYIIKLF